MTGRRQDFSAWWQAVDVFTLWAFAVAQPLYDLLARQPTFLVAHRATPGTVITMLLVLSFALPLLLVALEVLAGVLSPKVRRAIHLALIMILVSLMVAAPLRRAMTTISPAVVFGAACGFGLAFAYGYERWRPLRVFLTALALASVVFPMYFVLLTPARRILFPGNEASGIARVESSTPVVLIVFDELSLPSLLDERGKIDAIRYPSFARLAKSSWWFPHATATSPFTERAIPAILTGRYPHPDPATAPTASYFPDNLFTWLGTNRETHAAEVLTALCPTTICRSDAETKKESAARRELAADLVIVYLHQVTPPALAKRLLPPIEGTWRGFARADNSQPAPKENRDAFISRALVRFRSQVQQEDRGDQFMAAAARAGSERSLVFIHSLLPHIPWEHLPSGRRYTFQATDLPAGVEEEVWLDEQHLVRAGYHRYLLQLAFVDKLIGKLLDQLQASGGYDDSLLIVTADHGVSFQAGQPRRMPGSRNAPEIVRVPLFIKLPGQREGHVNGRLASGVDILPTIADVLDANLPWQSDGASLLTPGFPSRKRIIVDDKVFEPAAVLAPTPSWQRELFPPHSPASRLVPFGPHFVELVGGLVGNIPVRQTQRPLRFRPTNPMLLAGMKPLSAFLPALLEGEILSANADPGALTVAVAVNGRVQATVETFPWQGQEHYFSIVLPEAAFNRARNEVQVYLVDENAGELSLVPVPWEKRPSYRVIVAAQGTKLADDFGREFQVGVPPFELSYFLDRYYVRAGLLGLFGWVADATNDRPPNMLVLTLDNSSLIVSEPNVARPDVAKSAGAPLMMSGFSFELPQEYFRAALAHDPDLLSLRFFALFSDQAFELPIQPECKRELAASLSARRVGSPQVPQIPLQVELSAQAELLQADVLPGVDYGSLDGAKLTDDGSVIVWGWAYDPRSDTPADAVILFDNGQPVLPPIKVSKERPDVAEVKGNPRLRTTGWYFQLSASPRRGHVFQAYAVLADGKLGRLGRTLTVSASGDQGVSP